MPHWLSSLQHKWLPCNLSPPDMTRRTFLELEGKEEPDFLEGVHPVQPSRHCRFPIPGPLLSHLYMSVPMQVFLDTIVKAKKKKKP